MSQYGAYGYALHGRSYQFILAHYYQHTSLATTDPSQLVRVLLATGPQAAFSGATQAGTKKLNPSLTYSVRPRADGTLALIGPKGKTLGAFAAPLTAIGTGPLSVAGLGPYRGALEFRPDGSSGVETINALALDDYVRGVISREMPASWSAEALKAQAVAARTYAITTNRGGAAFDQYADTRSQVYGGVAAETSSTDAAVAVTRGQVVTYDGTPAVTYFFNSSGGHTENVEDVWPGSTPEPWLRGVPDPYDAAGGDPYHSWGYDLDTGTAALKLGSLVKGALLGISVTRHGASPRIITADVVGTKGRTSVSGSELQHAFGLLTANATFTTISMNVASVVGASVPRLPAPSGGPVSTGAMSALAPLVRALVAGTPAPLTGRVFGGRPDDLFTVQGETRSGWVTLRTARLAFGGRFALQPTVPGRYRVVYGGLDGPAVSVG